MCMTPYRVKLDNECFADVPCGKCPECKRRRVSAWSFRLMQEEKRSSAALFVTLTYDTTYVPITKNGFMSVDVRDCQLFFKRLRKCVSIHSPDTKIKYYLAAEYGGRTFRPHYHAIIFNVVNPYDIERSWMRGSVHYGQVAAASVGYTLKYIDKPKRIPQHRNDDRTPEFGLMSKGLGKNYLTEEVIQWHKNDLENRMHLVTLQGQKVSMPRYYKDKMYTDEEREQIAEFQKHQLIERENKLIAKYGNEKLAQMREQEILYKMKKFNNNYKKDKL